MAEFESKRNQKKLTPSLAFEKMKGWCAYQERAQDEVRNKLYEFSIRHEEAENIISKLISENYLNEERFALAFTSGKFRIKKWGRIKIKIELKKRKVSEYCIKKALAQIDETDYFVTLEKILEKRKKEEKETNKIKRQYKLIKFAMSKGFEQDLIIDALNNKNVKYES